MNTINPNYALSLDSYQAQALATCLPSSHNFEYLTLNLAAEAGEVAGKYAKYLRDGGAFPQADMIKELGDVLWQAAVLADKLGCTLSDVAALNLMKLRARHAAGTISGSGDNR